MSGAFMSAIESHDTVGVLDLDRPVALHTLTFLDEGEDVTVGRRDTDSYCVLPADGAALLRELERGGTPRDAAQWYAETYGQSVDMTEFLEAMHELGFVAATGENSPTEHRVRWQRFGKMMFSPVGWLGFAALLVAAVVVMTRHHDLLPQYGNLFFTQYMTIVILTLFFGQFPLLLIHESFHALAGRRLGLRSRIGIGRRLYFMVVETSMDGLVSVPRRQRYLPILAGMLADLLVIASLTLIAAALRHPDGSQPLVGGICLALAFATLLRFIWQFYFYLETDLYQVIVTVLGCVDLQKTARRTNANRFNRLLGRSGRVIDESTWHPTDRAVARWYSWLLAVGYAFSIATLVLAGLPATIYVFSVVLGRVFGSETVGFAGIMDTVVFLLVNVVQFAVIGVVAVRQRRRRRATVTAHVLD
jgi:hypothetical protein